MLTVNDNSSKYKNVDSIDSEMPIKNSLFVLNASMYLDDLFFCINCVIFSVYVCDYPLRGSPILQVRGVTLPGS
jgi:hypothetical protein